MCNQALVPAPPQVALLRQGTPQAGGEEPLVPLHPLFSEEIQESSAPVA